SAPPAWSDWDPGDPYTEWIRMPDLSTDGVDEVVDPVFVLGDDFQYTLTGPITDIHIWGSPLGDGIYVNMTITLGTKVAQRLRGEIGKDHPRVREIEDRLEVQASLIRELKVELEVSKIPVPETPEAVGHDAVWLDAAGSWKELIYCGGHPYEGQSMDLAFVTTTPIPPSLLLLGSGLLGLGALGWRRKKQG
ncbi:MAG: hypothetical protein P8X58_03150, partial [Syntrophobacterales bacterium]